MKIEDLFADEIGPVAQILCEESKQYWLEKVKKNGHKPSLRNIYLYINHLALSIEDEDSRKKFIDSVYSIESLQVLKS